MFPFPQEWNFLCLSLQTTFAPIPPTLSFILILISWTLLIISPKATEMIPILGSELPLPKIEYNYLFSADLFLSNLSLYNTEQLKPTKCNK